MSQWIGETTPGPWIYDSGCVYAEYVDGPRCGERVRLALMDREEHGTAPWERDANARLMAAAPVLFAALDNLVARGLIRGTGDHLEEVREALEAAGVKLCAHCGASADLAGPLCSECAENLRDSQGPEVLAEVLAELEGPQE